MIDLSEMGSAITILSASWHAWLWLVPGLVAGLFFGAMPGISISMGMALFLPLTLYMDFLPSIIFLTALYTGAGFGGSVPAILVNIPGTSSAIATTFDGYPMARQGRHNEALGVALAASTIGAALSYVVLTVVIAPLAKVVIKLGPLEMFAIAIWGMFLLGSLGGRYVTRGLFAGAFGLILGTIGMNTAGHLRGDMGILWLLDGIPLVPAMMGLLAVGQLYNLAGSSFIVQDENSRTISMVKMMGGVREAMRNPVIVLRGSAFGVIIGAIPGVGSSIANLISYGFTKSNDNDPSSYGQGNPKGVIAAESANSSSEGGAMATMLALGIPGGGATAILLAAFAMQNVTGGPSFISNQLDVVYAIILANLIQCILLVIVGLGFIYISGYVVRVPLRYLIPTVLVIASVGAYAIDGTISGPITLWIFSVFGWLFARYEYPPAAVVVGLVLGRILETELLRSFQVSGGELSYIFDRPMALAIWVVMFLSVGLTGWRKRRARKTEAI